MVEQFSGREHPEPCREARRRHGEFVEIRALFQPFPCHAPAPEDLGRQIKKRHVTAENRRDFAENTHYRRTLLAKCQYKENVCGARLGGMQLAAV